MADEIGEQTLLSLQELFSGNNVFRIPIYQRGYAWGDKQIDDLWEDIMNLSCLSETNRNGDQKHYTGLLVLEKIGSENKDDIVKENIKGKNGYYIVDGQQRITSLVIIYCLVSRELGLLDDGNLLNDNILYINGIKRFDYSRYRIDGSSDFFEKCVLKKGKNEPTNDLYQKNIENFYQSIESKIKSLAGGKETLKKLRKIILKDMSFNVFTISNEFDVRLTFETMNNRGKNLTHLELLKNRLMYLADFFEDTEHSSLKTNLIDAIEKAWGDIYKEFGKAEVPIDDDDFLKAHWSLIKTLDKQNNNGYIDDIFNKCFTVNNINKHRKEHSNERESGDEYVVRHELIAYVKDLSRFAKYWVFVNRPYDSKVSSDIDLGNEKDQYWISRISKISSHHHVLTALAALTSVVDDVYDFKTREKFYKQLEQFLFINLHLAKTKRNDMSTLVTRIKPLYLYKYGEDNNLNELFDVFKNEIFNNDATKITKERVTNILEKEFINYSTDDSGFYNWRGIKYFFFVYEYTKTPASQKKDFSWSDFDNKKTSIEHIYPQKPKENSFEQNYWKIAFQEYYKNLDEDKLKHARNRITHVIGNLGLISTPGSNSSLSNHIYPIKSGRISVESESDGQLNESYKYDRLNLRIVSDSYEYWTPNSILERTREMLNFLYDTWLKGTLGKGKAETDYWTSYVEKFISNLLDCLPNSQYRDPEDLHGKLDEIEANAKVAYKEVEDHYNPKKMTNVATKSLQKHLWTNFKSYAAAHGYSNMCMEQGLSHSYYDIDELPTVFRKCHLSLVYLRDEGLIQVSIRIRNNKDLFNELYKNKSNIEAEIGYELIWSEENVDGLSIIYVESPDYSNEMEDGNFESAFDWFLDNANKFIDVFTKCLSISSVPKVLKSTSKNDD